MCQADKTTWNSNRKMKLLSAHIFAIIIASVASLESSECLNHKMTNFVDFEVQCTRIENYEVKIVCHSNDWTKFPNVTLDLPYAALVSFENCSFPATLNVQSILNAMKVQSISKITFQELQSIPKRHNFKGLSTPQLNLLYGNFTELPFDLLYDVSNIRTLEISFTKLIRIPVGFFDDWSENILEIVIRRNKLEKITKNDFSHLFKVNTIDLSNNEINEIEPGAFDGLVHLDNLVLNANRLHSFPPGIFHQLIGLTKISIDGNSFHELPRDLFEGTKNLREFSMDRNSGTLTTLPHGLFKNLGYLRRVGLENNHLIDLPFDLFTGCYQLKEIVLNDNQLKTLPSNIFDDCTNLESLDIDRNQLESLPVDIFKELGKLKYLSIAKNHLTSLVGVLNGLKSVKVLVASDNYITQIDDEFLMYLESAVEINLSFNQLTFESKPSSTVAGNRTFGLDPSFELKTVYLNNNKIKKFDSGIINILKYSDFIDLGNNEISQINMSGFSLEMVSRNKTDTTGKTTVEYSSVILTSNPFHCDCNLADFVRYLNGWRENKLYNIFSDTSLICASPSKFKNQDVHKVRLEDVDCIFKTTDPNNACTETCSCRKYPAKQVLTVDCSHRNLTNIPTVIGSMFDWSLELNMSGNQLQHAPSLKDPHLINMASLDLSNNNITEVSRNLFSKKLHHLKLHGNSISRLDTKVIDYLISKKTLRSITLHDNKWICDCETRRLLTFVQKKFTRYDFHGMKCYGTDRKLYNMTASELCEGIIVTMISVCVVVTILSILVGSLVAIYCKYQREIKFWLYSKKLCLWFVTEDELDKDKEYDAFISFSHKDEDFVEREIVAKLEEGSKPYKLCLHYRDWLAGEWIPVQISRSVAESRRTIVILTPNFLESVWGLLEFRAAHTQALKEGRTRLIVIICGDIGNINDLDQEMKEYLRLNTYIKWGDPWFWDKLRYALPHGKEKAKSKTRNSDALTKENRGLMFPLSSGINSDTVRVPDVLSIPESTIGTSDSVNRQNSSPEDECTIA